MTVKHRKPRGLLKKLDTLNDMAKKRTLDLPCLSGINGEREDLYNSIRQYLRFKEKKY